VTTYHTQNMDSYLSPMRLDALDVS
jgi:hypothetical protein